MFMLLLRCLQYHAISSRVIMKLDHLWQSQHSFNNLSIHQFYTVHRPFMSWHNPWYFKISFCLPPPPPPPPPPHTHTHIHTHHHHHHFFFVFPSSVALFSLCIKIITAFQKTHVLYFHIWFYRFCPRKSDTSQGYSMMHIEAPESAVSKQLWISELDQLNVA